MRQKENKESFLKRWRESIILHIKEELEFIDVKVMAHVLTVVLMVSIIAGTVAWFKVNTSVGVTGLYLTTGSVDDVELSLEENNWENILVPFTRVGNGHDYENATLSVDISMPAFQNIYKSDGTKVETANSGIMAPGTYGSFTFYVKSVNSSCTKAELSIEKILDMAESEGSTEDEKTALETKITKLFNGHILCFAQIEDGSEYKYVSDNDAIEIDFGSFSEESEPKKVTIHWVWPYEYEDITADVIKINKTVTTGTAEAPAQIFSLPDSLPSSISEESGADIKTGDKLAINQIFEWERYNETLDDYNSADEDGKADWLIEWYDYADTLIGSYVKNMVFHIEVKGVIGDGEE